MIKAFGRYQLNMSNILDSLGVDEDDLDWWHLAACNGMETDLFFEKYETDVNIAKSIDECCLTCPVAKFCIASGLDNNEYGVWGGIFLTAGEVDKTRNIHKTEDVWKRIKAKHGH